MFNRVRDHQRTIRTTLLATVGLLVATAIVLGQGPSGPGFGEVVTPFLGTYCVGCHGKDKPKGDLDLSGFTTADAWSRDLATLQAVLDQIKGGTMPRPRRRPTRLPTCVATSSRGSRRFARPRRGGMRAIRGRSPRVG